MVFKMPVLMERDGYKIVHRQCDNTYHWVQDHHGSYHQGMGDYATPEEAFGELWEEVKDVFKDVVMGV